MVQFLAETACSYANNESVMGIISIAKSVVRILQIAIPIALIIWGTIDLGKAVIAGKEEEIQKAKKPFIQRIIAAVIVFLIPWLVTFIMSFLTSNEWYECWSGASSRLDKGGNSISNIIKRFNF